VGKDERAAMMEVRSGKKGAGAGPRRMDIHSARGISDNRALIGDEN
jgi:hypothetical protein